ncbi:helix-turn-helix domain-containing protein [Streptomyces umbrinus]|uniref:helix-turn-helix domain-containing protein n=1 Tax=Streptomyces umbrinus TaxID=67370 RepID=UPI0034475F82
MATLTSLRPADLLDNDQAAQYAGVSRSTIRVWVHRGLLTVALPGDGHRHPNLYAKPDLDNARRSLAEAKAARATPALHPTA